MDRGTRAWTRGEFLSQLERRHGRGAVDSFENFERKLGGLSDGSVLIRWHSSTDRVDNHATMWPSISFGGVTYTPPACFRVDGKVEIPFRYMQTVPPQGDRGARGPTETPFADEQARRKLQDRLREALDLDLPDSVRGRPTFGLRLLSSERAQEHLVGIFRWYVGEIARWEAARRTKEDLRLEPYHDYSREEVHDLFSPDTPFTPQSGTWGLQGIVAVPDRPGDYVFFVTLGQQQGDHVFDEGITEDGVLSWQSQPRQELANRQIRELIRHDELRNSVYLFFRTRKRTGYTYLGRLKYLSHDSERERPVHFQWQILDWDPPAEALEKKGLTLQPRAAEVVAGDVEGATPATDRLLETAPPPPRARSGAETTPSFTARKAPDYSKIDAKNRDLGLKGEKLVVEHEMATLVESGRCDLAERVRHVSQVEGDGAGYDVASFTPQGENKYVEVKTTRGPLVTPFYMSANEVEFSRSHADSYHLYRVYDYDDTRNAGRFYACRGDVGRVFDLTPTQYRARRAFGDPSSS